LASFLHDTADFWNDSIEGWTTVTNSELARQVGVDSYYVRIAPPLDGLSVADLNGRICIRNRNGTQGDYAVSDVVSPDALALVRFGLRDPQDKLIRNTLRVVDAQLKVDLPQGPVWRRYTGDGYGEHANGEPFDGSGIGRAWPLLTGERAHLELAAGRSPEATRLLATLEDCASDGFMLPEQVWDAADIPARELFRGRPSGSAMPLVWAHAEHVKLLRSLADGTVFDTPPQTVRRYLRAQTRARCHVWRPDWRAPRLVEGRCLRVELPNPATVHWSGDGWRTALDTDTADIGIGIHAAELATDKLPAGATLILTWRFQDGRWAGLNHTVTVVRQESAATVVV
jgi:glucoamylase